jgi:maltose O-acetyltransferase
MAESTLTSLADYVNANFSEDGLAIGTQESLNDHPAINSVKMLELLLYVEEQFGIEIKDDDEVVTGDSATLAGLAAYIDRRLAAGGSGNGALAEQAGVDTPVATTREVPIRDDATPDLAQTLDLGPLAPVEAADEAPLTLQQMLRRLREHPGMIWPLLNAQLRLRAARKHPLTIRLWGRARVFGGGDVLLGERVRIFANEIPVTLVAWGGGRLQIGDGVSINYGTTISAHEFVSIGKDCLLAQEVIINDNDYHDIVDKRKTPPSKPVVIEDRVWLGPRVIVQKGVRIGHDSVVAAGSLVAKDIPPRSLAMGYPARVVRTF